MKSRKDSITLGLLVSVAAASIASSAALAGNAKGKPFVALQDQIVEVQGAVSTIQGQLQEIIGDVESLESRLTASEGAIDDLTDENEYLTVLAQSNLSSIEEIQTEIGALEDQITALSADAEANAEHIGALRQTITTLQ